jgi:thiol-disulfide isomerase/thioredoxin
MSDKLPIITSIPSVQEFQTLIENNTGVVIIKLGAKWCGPCSRIEPYVLDFFNSVPNNIQCVTVDIDISSEFYSFLKKKRIANGVPVILCYLKENKTYYPDDYAVGSDLVKLDEFFKRCIGYSTCK